MIVYVVIWDCLTPRPVAVFHDRARAETLAREFKAGVDALMKRIGLTGDERVYVSESPFEPPSVGDLPARTEVKAF